MDFDGDCPQTGRCRRPPMVVIMDTYSCKAHSVPMTTLASDMYGHTEKHIRYSTSLFQQEPTENWILPNGNAEKSYRTSSSPTS